jgi:hypothetical protein
MSTSTLALANFLLARFAEQMRAAEAAQTRSSYGLADTAFAEAVELAEGEGARRPAIEHILHWDPLRVLADLNSKWQVVRWCMHHTANPYETGPVLQMLAEPFADHPDYEQEWAPWTN